MKNDEIIFHIFAKGAYILLKDDDDKCPDSD